MKKNLDNNFVVIYYTSTLKTMYFEGFEEGEPMFSDKPLKAQKFNIDTDIDKAIETVEKLKEFYPSKKMLAYIKDKRPVSFERIELLKLEQSFNKVCSENLFARLITEYNSRKKELRALRKELDRDIAKRDEEFFNEVIRMKKTQLEDVYDMFKRIFKNTLIDKEFEKDFKRYIDADIPSEMKFLPYKGKEINFSNFIMLYKALMIMEKVPVEEQEKYFDYLFVIR